MARGRSPKVKAWEAAAAAAALMLGFHFLAIRVRAGAFPGGDEGSWLSAAAELARGRGFTTRWLEGHFLEPYALPRPDDFRFPALTSLLALAFRLFGVSVETARWTVTGVFLAFAFSLWLVCRAAFGRWAGLGALWLACASLLQLEWSSGVYTEGLFGLVLAALAAWSLKGGGPRGMATASWWAVLGGLIGALYLVRPNALLFLPGTLWLFWLGRKSGLSWTRPAAAWAACLLVASPWLIRTAIRFGNPFHIAGNAGLLRDNGQSHTLTLGQYLAQHNPLYPLERLVLGIPRFFAALDFYEHGLEIVPLGLALAAAGLRLPFFGPFLAAGFAASATVCFYAAYNGWAAVRYMSPMLPFLYAYGLSLPPVLLGRFLPGLASGAASPPSQAAPPVRRGPSLPAFAAGAAVPGAALAGIAMLLLPVIHPHRFYERRYARALPSHQAVADHLRRLGTLLPENGTYYAASLCKVNFLAERTRCVGLQELYDSTWFRRSMAAFRPGLLVLTREEARDGALLAALGRMGPEGYTRDSVAAGPLAVYYAVTKRPAPEPPRAEGGAP